MKSRFQQKAGFYGQVLWIAVPLAALSVFALYSLRQDRSDVEQEARKQAQVLASDLAERWSEYLQKDIEEFLIAWGAGIYAPAARAWPEGIGAAAGRDTFTAGLPGQPGREALQPDKLAQLQGRLLNGRVLVPVDYPPLPVPPAWAGELTLEQARLLQAAEQALYQQRNPAAAGNLMAAMKRSGMPEPAIASVQLNLLLLETASGATEDSMRRLTDLARTYPRTHTQSGTPVADLALIRAMRQAPPEPLPESLRQELFRRVLRHPSFLTPELTAAAENAFQDPQSVQSAQILKSIWLAQERTREFLRALLQQPMEAFQRTTETWLEADAHTFLAQYRPVFQSKDENHMLHPPGSEYRVTLIPGTLLEQGFLEAFGETRSRIPAYLAASVQMGGRRWPLPGSPNDSGMGVPASELAAAAKVILVRPDLPDSLRLPYTRGGDLEFLAPPEELTLRFALSLSLANPDLLYASYRRRLWLAAGLILTATAAAGIGLVSAWRAFRRQLQLAEMTSNFVSSVSHELRAPLASVRLMAESLDQGRVTDDEKRKGYFRLIVQECRRLSALVENVLDFSRIRQGRKQYESEPVDLPTLVRQTVGMMEPVAAEHQVRLTIAEPSSGAENLQPSWDGQAVQQALVNLIDNAIKHSPAGATVMVEYKAIVVPAGSSIHISVGDQGPGIPADEQQSIFEPFFRRGSELRRETRGIGIGLSIVKHVAEAHGGRVIVESTVGQGSRFVLELPFETKPQTNADEIRV